MKFDRMFAFVGVTALALALLGLGRTFDSSTASPTTLDSVVMIETETEEPVNPFSFFFGPHAAPMFGVSTTPKTEIHHMGGSGFVVEGHMLTALHVVKVDGKDSKVLSITFTTHDGRSAVTKIVQEDADHDLAELSYAMPIPALRLSITAPYIAQDITEIGHPYLIPFIVTHGHVSGYSKKAGFNVAAVETFHGNSGGPILSSATNEVVGMCHTKIEGTLYAGIGTWESLRNFIRPDAVR